MTSSPSTWRMTAVCRWSSSFGDRLQSVLQDVKGGGRPRTTSTTSAVTTGRSQLSLPDEGEGIPVINLRTPQDRAVAYGQQWPLKYGVSPGPAHEFSQVHRRQPRPCPVDDAVAVGAQED